MGNLADDARRPPLRRGDGGRRLPRSGRVRTDEPFTFTKPGVAGIWSQAAGGGEPALALADLAPEDWDNWDVGERGIFFRRLDAKHPQPVIAFLAFGQTEAAEVAPLPQQGWSGLSVSRDGRSLIYSRVDRQSCDIRLIENPR